MKNFWKAFGALALRKAAEPSTWAGVAALASAAGVAVNPQNAALIASVGASVAGMALVAANEAK